MSISAPSLEQPWDLVVVGHGAAGLSAAAAFLEAYGDETPRVAILDRQPAAERGGSTAWTTASFRLDDNAQLAEDWGQIVRQTAGHEIDEAYIEAFYEHATDTLNWIRGHGVRISKSLAPFPGLRMKYGYSIEGGGRAFVGTFTELVQAKGARCVYGADAIGLVREPGQPVTGVRVRVDGAELVMPTAAVVLACGGFEGNRELLGQHIPGGSRLDTVAPGSRVNKGAGISIATAIGAATSGQFDGAHLEPVDPRSPNPESLVNSWMWGILVDRDGRRFIDEASTTFDILFDYIANAVHRRAGGLAYAINDASVRKGIPNLHEYNWTPEPPITADTLEELAAKTGIDPAGLRTTVDAYNAATDDVPFDAMRHDGKRATGIEPPKSNWAQPLTEGPFEAWPVSPRICFTYYGLKVDGRARVLDTNGRPIGGLYAAGEITGIFHHTYPSGTSVLRSLTFGRIAGRGAASTLTAPADAGASSPGA
jgi:tricarballylate dehydrogenase